MNVVSPNEMTNGIQYLPEETERIYAPLEWQRLGRMQTATGYGSKLTTPWMVDYNGRRYRVYATCWSNAATHWIQTKGQKLYLRG